MGSIRAKEAIGELRTATTADSDEIRYYAVRALANICDLSAVPALVDRLQDQSNIVRKQAIYALTNILSNVRFAHYFRWSRNATDALLVYAGDARESKRLKRVISRLKHAALDMKDWNALKVALEIESRIRLALWTATKKNKEDR